MSTENKEIFVREMLGLLLTSSDSYCFKLLWGTEVRTKHTDNYLSTYEKLCKTAAQCDDDGLIEDAVMGGAYGHLYRKMTEIRDNIPEGFTIGVYDFDPDTRD